MYTEILTRPHDSNGPKESVFPSELAPSHHSWTNIACLDREALVRRLGGQPGFNGAPMAQRACLEPANDAPRMLPQTNTLAIVAATNKTLGKGSFGLGSRCRPESGLCQCSAPPTQPLLHLASSTGYGGTLRSSQGRNGEVLRPWPAEQRRVSNAP